MQTSQIHKSYGIHPYRFGQKGAFIRDGEEFAQDRESFYSSTKRKLELILYCYQQQYQECLGSGVSSFHKTLTLDTIRGFLLELQSQALACQDGMMFIPDTYDTLTRGNTPTDWLLELRTAIWTAIIPDAARITGNGGLQIHAQTAVTRIAAMLGFGPASYLPYRDSHEERSRVQVAMTYAQGRLLLEFPHNYNYDSVCAYVVEKLRSFVEEALQEAKEQVVIKAGQRQPLYHLLKTKLDHPPLSYADLDIDKILVYSEVKDAHYLDAGLLDRQDFQWALYFVNRAKQLLVELDIIYPDSQLLDIARQNAARNSTMSSSLSSSSSSSQLEGKTEAPSSSLRS